MAKKIKIAELAIDDKALLESTEKLKKSIDSLKKDQKELTKLGLTSSKAYIQNASDIKVLNSAYNQNIKVMSERTKKIAEEEGRQDLLNIALKEEAVTIEDLRAQNKLLNKLRNTANIETAEGVEELSKLNAKLDENNEKIKENVDAYTKQKIEIGGYKDAIKEAFQEMNIFNGGLGGFIQRSKEAGGVGNLLTNSFKGMAQGLVGLTRASLAFIATPIGAILAIIAGAVGLVINAFKRSEDSANKVKKAFAPLTGLFNKLLSVLEPVGNFLIDVFVKAMLLAEKVMISTLKAIARGLEFLGLDSAAEGLRNFADAVEETAEASRKLADAEAQLAKNQREVERTQLKFQKNAEKLRQLRDDESKTIKERIAANNELGELLKKQGEAELVLAKQALLVTELRIQQEGEITELLDEKGERLLKIAEIEERILSQQSEQLTNNISLRKEGEDKRRETAEKRIESMRAELDFIKESRRFETDSIAKSRDLAKEELTILDQKLKDRLISQTEYNTESLRIKNDLIEKEKEFEDAELERLLDFQNRKRELEDEIRLKNTESAEEREIIKAEIQFEKDVAEVEKLIEDEQQRTELLALIEEDRGLVLAEIRGKFEEIRQKGMLEAFKKEGEIAQRSAQAQINIARSLASTLIGVLGDSLGARVAAIAIDAAIQTGLISITTAAAQARNFAQATASAPPPFNAANILLAAKQNVVMEANSQAQKGRILTSAALQGIGTIASKVKFAEGGIAQIQGPRHSGGGVPVFAGNQYIGEAEGDEGIGILSRSAFAPFMAYNDMFGSGKSQSGQYAGGGIITNTVKPSSETDIVEGMREAIADMKQPVVLVEDIDRGFNDKNVVEIGANS